MVKLVGDVRLTLCTTIDECFSQMFASAAFIGVVIDLSDAEGIDSTSLGLLAKLAIQAKQRYQQIPLVLSPNPSITRLLTSMGFDRVLDIRDSVDTEASADNLDEGLGELPVVCSDEDCVRNKVIEAHRFLMDMNEHNRAAFADLVTTLEASQ